MIKLALALAATFMAQPSPLEADEPRTIGVPYYAAGARIEGAVVFDMATLQGSGGLRSIRV